MDIRCPKCGEPWDLDELHYVDGMLFDEARAAFRQHGCALFGTSHSTPSESARSGILAALMDMAGDDIDGYAADVEDFEAAGLL